MTDYITTRTFPNHLTGRVGDLIPRWCRSARISHFDDGLATVTAHRSEIREVRAAINLAKADALLLATSTSRRPSAADYAVALRKLRQ